MQKSADMERLINSIREGKTREQQNRDLREKVIFSGGQALATGVGGYLQGRESDAIQEEHRNRTGMARAIDSQTRERNRLLTPAADYVPNTPDSPDDPEWLMSGHLPPEQTDLSMATDQHRQDQDGNAAAAGATIGGYRTPSAMDDQDQESDTLAADMNTGKNLMRVGGAMRAGGAAGGMQRSIPRSR